MSLIQEMLAAVRGHDSGWLACAMLLTMFTVYSSLRLTEQVAAERGVERRAWLAGSGAVAGLARLAVQLCLLRFLGVTRETMYDVSWLSFGLFLAVCGRLAAIDSITRPGVRLRRLVPVGMFEGATILGTQLVLFRAAHIWYPLSWYDALALLVFCGVVCATALTMAARLIERSTLKQSNGGRVAYLLATAVVIFLVRSAVGLPGSIHKQQLPLDTAAFEVPGVTVSFMILFAGVVLCAAQTSLFLHRRAARWNRTLQESQEKEGITAALAEQRVVRLQNESLLEEIRERKKMEAKLAYSAFHDSVTGLYNRAYLSEQIQDKLRKKGPRCVYAGALLYIDLDNFQSVNDMLGHSQGDRLLVKVAERLRPCLRDSDVLARMAGDEFAVLLSPMPDADRAMRHALHMLSILEEPMEVAGTSFNLSASIGVGRMDDSYTSAEIVLRDADLAMYRAKREGGARAVLYQHCMHAQAVEAMNARVELKRAIAQEEFVLWYQPLVDMRDGSIYGMEALIRWMHPQKGLVGPGAFIPLAEETGHIVDIGTWVLRKGCADYAVLQKHAAVPLLMTLNVSTRQLELNNFMDLLKQTLTETGIPPNQLQLELTESVLSDDPVRMGELFQEIRELGVKIAFDDFGTGYSSLSYIQRFPVDTLKIDQSFVRALKNGPVNADIIRLMIQLSEVTGMRVSGEGVETPDEAAALLALGCHVAQGYLYSKPVPMDDFLELLRKPSLATAEPRRSGKRTPAAAVAYMAPAGGRREAQTGFPQRNGTDLLIYRDGLQMG